MFEFLRCRRNTPNESLPPFENKPFIISKDIDINDIFKGKRVIKVKNNEVEEEEGNNIEIFEGQYKPQNLNKLDRSKNYIAFSGIGNPENFNFTLKENDFKILKYFSFPDHYNYKNYEINNIKRFAIKNNSEIITTEKDFLRINRELRKNISYIEMDLIISNENKLLELIS